MADGFTTHAMQDVALEIFRRAEENAAQMMSD
jgi:hypothetical protein